MQLYQSIIPSPLGDLLAIASDKHLLMLEFADSEELEEKIAKLTKSHFVILTKEGSAAEKMLQIPRTSE
jgi:O6-methylguanine-DNA--protein-cysteine methyltransferase